MIKQLQDSYRNFFISGIKKNIGRQFSSAVQFCRMVALDFCTQFTTKNFTERRQQQQTQTTINNKNGIKENSTQN